MVLEVRGVRSFGALIRREEAELRYLYKEHAIASDLTKWCLLVLPSDAPKLGIDDPNYLSVTLAVGLSMSIPIFFEPVKFANPKTGSEYFVVDGGMLSNFPVWLFDAEEPLWPSFGLQLVKVDPRAPADWGPPQPKRPRSGVLLVVDYLRSLVDTMVEAHDRLFIEEAEFDRAITIDTLGVRITEFDLSEASTRGGTSGGVPPQRSSFLDEHWHHEEHSGRSAATRSPQGGKPLPRCVNGYRARTPGSNPRPRM